jgi:hypothetical protein
MKLLSFPWIVPAVAIAVVMVAALPGCKDLGTEPDPAAGSGPVTPQASISFQARVLPILTNYGCTGCHGGSGGLFVGTVAQLLTGGNHGAAVVAGNGPNSNLIKKLGTPAPFGSSMPLGGSALPADTIAVLRTWIDQGALNN